MKYSYNWLKELVDLKNISPAKLASLIESRSFEVERVEQAHNAGQRDWVLSIETGKTNRVDALGHWGMAGEISAITGRAMMFEPETRLPAPSSAGLKLRVRTDLCRKYAGWKFTGVTVGPSPQWLQARLLALGLKPVNNVVDIANYVMLLTGQPLHAFDAKKIRGNLLQVRPAKNKEKLKTLDGEEVKLSSADIVVADGNRAVALAGIKGGVETGISKQTKEIILEAANFEPVKIRRTSWRVGLRSDAAHRFEKNLPLELVDMALLEAKKLLIDLAQASPGPLALKTSVTPKPERVILSLNYLRELLGYKVPAKRVERLLSRLGFLYRKQGRAYRVAVPFYRPDVRIAEDLVEEIGRLDGYEHIPERKLKFLTGSKPPRAAILRDQIREMLLGQGFAEVYNYSFYSRRRAQQSGLALNQHFTLLNPMSQDQELLRISLLPNLLAAAEYNLRFTPTLAFYEFGNVYSQKETAMFHDSPRLGLCYADSGKPKETFLYLKGKVSALLDGLHVSHGFRAARDAGKLKLEVLTGEKKYLGEISLRPVGKTFIAVAELDFVRLLNRVPQNPQYREFSRMPQKTLDLAMIVDAEIPWAAAENIVRAHKLVKSVNLFDVYQGGQIAAGKKSLAFEIRFQDMKRTLSDEEVKNQLTKITAQLKSKLGATFR